MRSAPDESACPDKHYAGTNAIVFAEPTAINSHLAREVTCNINTKHCAAVWCRTFITIRGSQKTSIFRKI